MPKLKPETIIPTEEEDALINAGISADPDSNELSDFFDLETFKGTEKGWQTRVNAALRQFLNEHPIKKEVCLVKALQKNQSQS
jgi:hypothetical protein